MFSLIGIYPEWNVKRRCSMYNLNSFENWNISRMECKVTSSNNFVFNLLNWNISRMECKGNNSHNPFVAFFYWNISRMECKEICL